MAKTSSQLDKDLAPYLRWGKRGKAYARPHHMDKRLFIGTFSTGISYADRSREKHGDYMKVAFLPFDTLELEWMPGKHPAGMKEMIKAHAAQIAVRRGEQYPISSSGQTITLGHGRKHHLTKKKKSAIPAITKWNMYGGGTGAAKGKHSYDFYVTEGQYTIDPISSRHGRHQGYSLKFAATGAQPKGGHSGLWHDLGLHRAPASAAKAAREHYAKSFGAP